MTQHPLVLHGVLVVVYGETTKRERIEVERLGLCFRVWPVGMN